jgi:DNA-binding NarL/FixJ family response regulator
VALHAGAFARAAERALASVVAADEVEAPIEAALSRTLAGPRTRQAGQRDRAVAELQHAVAAFDACGALRYRQSAERELGKLGHRPHRRTRPGKGDGIGIESLTGRELEVSRLVVDHKSNPQITADLFLSKKTVETYLRNIFTRRASLLGPTSRVPSNERTE